MTNYLAPVLREQFNKYYRYGYTFIPKAQLLVFDGTISEKVKDEIADLFGSLTPFEYDEDYLILHLDKSENEPGVNVRFEIQNLVSVYPLSQKAKESIASKIDHRIKLEHPIFEDVLSLIEDRILEQEIGKAVEALWLICGLEGSSADLTKLIGFENILKGLEFRKNGVKASKISMNSYWSYLLAYDRYDYFPNSILGYVYDAGQIFAYYKNYPSFEGSSLHEFLENLNTGRPDIKLKELIDLLETEEKVSGYTSQAVYKGIKMYSVSPIFLFLKNGLRSAEDVNQTELVRNNKYLLGFGDSYKAAVILLGAFFGFKKFYDVYYDKLSLRFYKSAPPKYAQQGKIFDGLPGDTAIVIAKKPAAKKISSPKTLAKQTQASKEVAIVQSNEEYKEIILTALKLVPDKGLAELAKELKVKTGKKNITNQVVKDVVGGMKDVELFKDKKTEKARIRKP